MAKSQDYWRERFVQLEEAQDEKGAKYFAELEKQYNKAALAIQDDINKWYGRFAKNNKITLQEARKLLNSRELEELRWNVMEYIDKGKTLNISNQWAKQLENASARFHISRLEAIKLQIQNQVEVLYGNELDEVTKLMTDIYTDGYYHTAYEIQKGFNIGYDLMKLDGDKVAKVLSKPWAADGSNFSDRIWKHKSQLLSELHNGLTQAIIKGQDPSRVTDAIAKRFNVSKGRAGALVMTESAFFAAASDYDAYKDLGVEQYEILATLDKSTSSICRSLDGKVFPISQYEVGVTAPPFHVRCRTTTVPFFDDEFELDTKRAARDENGKTYFVPSDMKYKDWKKAFVDGGSKMQYLRNNLPKGFIDPRNVGDVISSIDLQAFVDKADSYGIRTTGFETYCGDVDTLNEVLEQIHTNKTHFILDNVQTENIILNYDNVLGYKGDSSMIDIGAFAETRGKTITLNKYMFDDSDFLKKEYVVAVEEGYFSAGTSYLNIVDHEYGHILDKENPKLYRKILEEIEKMAYNDGKQIGTFIEENISIYAKTLDVNGDYSELIPELYSMANGSNRSFAIALFRKVGVLYEN